MSMWLIYLNMTYVCMAGSHCHMANPRSDNFLFESRDLCDKNIASHDAKVRAIAKLYEYDVRSYSMECIEVIDGVLQLDN